MSLPESVQHDYSALGRNFNSADICHVIHGAHAEHLQTRLEDTLHVPRHFIAVTAPVN